MFVFSNTKRERCAGVPDVHERRDLPHEGMLAALPRLVGEILSLHRHLEHDIDTVHLAQVAVPKVTEAEALEVGHLLVPLDALHARSQVGNGERPPAGLDVGLRTLLGRGRSHGSRCEYCDIARDRE